MPKFNKMHSTTGNAMPHIGNLLAQVMKLRMITQKELAQKLDIHPSGINLYVKQPSMHAALLWKIGEVLEYNFFTGLAGAFPVHKPTELELELQQKVADLKKENELYQKILAGRLGQ